MNTAHTTNSRLRFASATAPGATVFCQWLADEGIDTIFLVPGLQIDPLFGRMAEVGHFRLVVANHELAAGFMADGYARASHKLGVCLGIGTIGATNMLTAAATARADDSAVLFVTGNVPGCLRERGAFQDGWPGGTNDQALFQALLGWSAVAEPDNLRKHLEQAARLMRKPHRRPTHIAIPFEVQKESANSISSLDSLLHAAHHADSEALVRLSATLPMLSAATRMVILAGPRALEPGMAGALRCFAETFSVPVATTLSAKGLLPENHPLSLGNFGFGGSRRAIAAMFDAEVDLLLVLGADFNERDSLCWDQRLAANRAILRVDPKLVEHRHSLRPRMEIAADCVTALRFWLDARDQGLRALRTSVATRTEWCARWAALPGIPPLLDPVGLAPDTVSLDQLMAALRQHLPDDAVLVVDAGVHRVFAGQYWQARRPNSFFSACALAPMGWAISAAVGIQIARPQQPVVVLTGDGCMRTHGGELATLARYQLPVLVVVCDNEGYGSVYRRHQAGGLAAEHNRLPKVDWPQFATSLGAGGACVSTLEQLHRFFQENAAGLRSRKRPCLLAVKTPLVQALPEGTSNRSALVPLLTPTIRPSGYPQ